jgi:hypothetical protein
MIFGHAPIILPAILGFELAYSPVFYLPLTLLHGSLALRLIGDLAGIHASRMWGGLVNAIAILSFFGLAAGTAMYGNRRRDKT